MDICPNCFTDQYLQDFISSNSETRSICPQCGNNGPIADASILFDAFFGLSEFYDRTSGNDSVLFSSQIQKDHKIFSTSDSQFHQQFIEAVFGGLNPDFVHPQAWAMIKHSEVEDEWNRFAEEIKHKNRFFTNPPFTDINIAGLYSLLEETVTSGSLLYRARLNTHEKRYNKKSMGAPPNTMSNGGRANPKGIPYLYLASKKEVAIAEIRPAKGQTVTVGNFRTMKDLKLVNFEKISPFKLILSGKVNSSELSKVNKVIKLIKDKLSEPINPLIADLEYLTTQFICEEIKSQGFDGVSFPSAMGIGTNYAIFDIVESCKCNQTEQKTINNIVYEISRSKSMR